MPGRETTAGQKRNLLRVSVVRFACGSPPLWEFHAIALIIAADRLRQTTDSAAMFHPGNHAKDCSLPRAIPLGTSFESGIIPCRHACHLPELP